jgi:hypothetical protein
VNAAAAQPAPSTWLSRIRPSRADTIFYLTVIAVYLAATVASIHYRHLPWDRMTTLADQILHGRVDSPDFKGTADSVLWNGHYYIAVGPLQVLPYLPFAILGHLQDLAGHIVATAIGGAAALLALPLARAYGARGAAAYWVAGFTAFGTLLLFLSTAGNFYWLAQAESFLALVLFLIEWAGRRRPLVLGICLGFSFLARPTTALAAIPFGLALIWKNRDAVKSAIAFGLPMALAVAVYGWFNWLRFASPFEAGYALSYLPQPGLDARRALGLFSLAQVPENLRLALLAPFERLGHFPYFTANPYGLSMLLVSPALLTAAWAGIREGTARLLWIAAGLVAIPVFLYYGGGYIQYGFRYSLDFTPFLIALVAMGSGRWKGWPERLLIVASIASVAYGLAWLDITSFQH